MNVYVHVHPSKYADNNIVDAMMTKDWSFELNIESDTDRMRRLLTLEQATKLRDDINKAIEQYNELMVLKF